MPDPKQDYDSEAFFSALDTTIRARHLKWKDVSDQTGVSTSTLSRMAQGRGPDGASLVSLASWAGLDLNSFHKRAVSHHEPLALVTTALRRDPRLTPEAAQTLEAMFVAAYDRLAAKDDAGKTNT